MAYSVWYKNEFYCWIKCIIWFFWNKCFKALTMNFMPAWQFTFFIDFPSTITTAVCFNHINLIIIIKLLNSIKSNIYFIFFNSVNFAIYLYFEIIFIYGTKYFNIYFKNYIRHLAYSFKILHLNYSFYTILYSHSI